MTRKAKSERAAAKTKAPSASPRRGRNGGAGNGSDRADVLATLRARALKLAEPRITAAAVPRMRIVVFTWRDQSWAVDSDLIDEVIPVPPVTPLPGLPPSYMGLIHYRREIYPLIDISTLLDIASASRQKPTHALLVKCDRGAIALAATGLEGASAIDIASICAMASEDTRHPALRGLTPSRAVILDPHRLLDDARLIVNEQPATAATAEGNAP